MGHTRALTEKYCQVLTDCSRLKVNSSKGKIVVKSGKDKSGIKIATTSCAFTAVWHERNREKIT